VGRGGAVEGGLVRRACGGLALGGGLGAGSRGILKSDMSIIETTSSETANGLIILWSRWPAVPNDAVDAANGGGKGQ
jgi:hypothetical protein